MYDVMYMIVRSTLLRKISDSFSSRRPIGTLIKMCDVFVYCGRSIALQLTTVIDIVTSGLLSITIVVKTRRKPTTVSCSPVVICRAVIWNFKTRRIPRSIFIADDFWMRAADSDVSTHDLDNKIIILRLNWLITILLYRVAHYFFFFFLKQINTND